MLLRSAFEMFYSLLPNCVHFTTPPQQLCAGTFLAKLFPPPPSKFSKSMGKCMYNVVSCYSLANISITVKSSHFHWYVDSSLVV